MALPPWSIRVWWLVIAAVACGGESPAVGPADLVIIGASVHTADPAEPLATALAVLDGRIVEVGTDESVAPYIGPDTRVIELEGEAVLPGFADGHVHFESGQSLVRGVDLTGIAERSEWLRRVGDRARELDPGEWIVGGRWDHTLTPGSPWPTKD
ncbi:MAG: amidohydrolase family protein, partial [Gemmatimonadota bacterium]|nr:amidohydrolase family protein [Gemmatimonadota bacterium]